MILKGRNFFIFFVCNPTVYRGNLAKEKIRRRSFELISFISLSLASDAFNFASVLSGNRYELLFGVASMISLPKPTTSFINLYLNQLKNIKKKFNLFNKKFLIVQNDQ